MATGIVKWFSDAKGFGFIEPDDKGADVFAHFSAIKMDGFKTLKQGVRVSYELQDGPKGPHAQDILLLSSEQDAVDNAVTDASNPPSTQTEIPESASTAEEQVGSAAA